MKGMLSRFVKYFDKKGLNVDKSKGMMCRKGGGRRKKITWRWKGKILEKVEEFSYLGYVIRFNGQQNAHINSLSTKFRRSVPQ